ncbi:MAG TPA: GNAT family N-acetyltransferase [Gammaproteobacteria bacterium]|nr:GNAT family N-acetyltransferase [Gammaproteobacteria bacterium]
MSDASATRWTERLADGTEVEIRPLVEADVAKQQAFFHTLSPDSRRSAFLVGTSSLSPTWLERLRDPSRGRDLALVATVRGERGESQIGLGRYAWTSPELGAELAITVADAWQRKGVGTLLLEHLIETAQARGIGKLYSMDRADNAAMRKLAMQFGAAVSRDPEDARQIIAMLDLPASSNRGSANQRVRDVVGEIVALERELERLAATQQAQIRYRIEGTKVRFEQSVKDSHARVKRTLLRWLGESDPRNVVSAPFVYGMVVPFAILDLALTIYQAVCFRLYRIPRVRRGDYIVIDRQHLSYLNAVEKLNCVYCGYANGLFAYAREIAARTEQYWCPVKHARRVLDPHRRYAGFAEFGEAEAHQAHVAAMRSKLVAEGAASGSSALD